jgi:hypothetical protein
MKKNGIKEKKFEKLIENVRCLLLTSNFDCEREQLIYDICRQNGLHLTDIKNVCGGKQLIFNNETILLTF